jgi:hypothetical protein
MRLVLIAAAGFGLWVGSVWVPLGALAQPASVEDAEREHERWIVRLTQRQDELRAARLRAERAEDAYRDWRQRKWPRGEEKEAMLAELAEAKEALRIAERRLPRDLEAARRAGVPPGHLRRFRE